MANGANRIFKIMQKSGTDTISEVVYLTVKSTKPLTLNLENRLDISEQFIVLNDEIDKSKIKTGDKLIASTFNGGQCYFIQQAQNKDIKKSTGLEKRMTDLENRNSNLEKRIATLEKLIQ